MNYINKKITKEDQKLIIGILKEIKESIKKLTRFIIASCIVGFWWYETKQERAIEKDEILIGSVIIFSSTSSVESTIKKFLT